jgi:hypothetical protein
MEEAGPNYKEVFSQVFKFTCAFISYINTVDSWTEKNKMSKLADIEADLKVTQKDIELHRVYFTIGQLNKPCNKICLRIWEGHKGDKLERIDHYHAPLSEVMDHEDIADRKIPHYFEEPLGPEMKVCFKLSLSEQMVTLYPKNRAQEEKYILILPEMGEKNVFFSMYNIETVSTVDPRTFAMYYKICEGDVSLGMDKSE